MQLFLNKELTVKINHKPIPNEWLAILNGYGFAVYRLNNNALKNI